MIMTNITNSNCIVCAQEFAINELKSLASSIVNNPHFKICESCLDLSDPKNDFEEAKKIVEAFSDFNYTKSLFKEVKSLIDK
jgi:hypothetical protein